MPSGAEIEAVYRYGRSRPMILARLAVGVALFGVGAAGGAFLALTNTRRLILNGIPFSVSQASVIYGILGLLSAVAVVLTIVQCIQEATVRRWLVFTREGLLIPRESGTGSVLVPYADVRGWVVSRGAGRGDPEQGAQIRVATDLAEFRIIEEMLRTPDYLAVIDRLERRWPRSLPDAEESGKGLPAPGGREYQVSAIPFEGPSGRQVVARFEDLTKAEQFARFLGESGTYREIEVNEGVAPPAPPVSRAELGKVLLERRPSLLVRVLVLLILVPVGLLFMTGGVANLYWKARQVAQGTGLESPWWVPIPLLAAGAAFLAGAWSCMVQRFRCHRRGISRRGLLGTCRLLYEEIDDVVPKGIQVLLFGVIPIPFSTRIELSFLPAAGRGLRPIVFVSDAIRDPDPDALYGEVMRIVDRNTPDD